MKNLSYVLITLATALTLNSCNTFIGASRDIQKLGTGLENKAHGRTWDGQPQLPTPVQ